MQQNTTKPNKRAMWSVYVFVKMGPMSKQPYMKFLYLNVIKMFKRGKILHIRCIKKEKHMHDISRIMSVQVREYDKSGRIM
jgi:hypothetical protein